MCFGSDLCLFVFGFFVGYLWCSCLGLDIGVFVCYVLFLFAGFYCVAFDYLL